MVLYLYNYCKDSSFYYHLILVGWSQFIDNFEGSWSVLCRMPINCYLSEIFLIVRLEVDVSKRNTQRSRAIAISSC